jgi:hypothetical protein
MTSNTSLPKPPLHRAGQNMTSTSTTSSVNSSSAKRSRGSYRRQLTAKGSAAPTAGVEAKRTAAVILEVLAGVRTPAGAATALGIHLPRYYLWEQRALEGLVAACEPRPRGRAVSVDRRLASLERELAVARRDLTRHQALARTAQRALGLSAPADSLSPAAARGKAKGKSQETPAAARSKRRRRPTARALRAARLLRDADSSGTNSTLAVQSGYGPPGAGPYATVETSGAASAGEGNRPATTREPT